MTTKKHTQSKPLQADPMLLSVLSKLSECRDAIFNYEKTSPDGYVSEHAKSFDESIANCQYHIGDLIGYQLVGDSDARYIPSKPK